MARELILNLSKNKSSFGISKIDRKKLYGFKKRLFLDEKGKECSKANLEEETSFGFVDPTRVEEKKYDAIKAKLQQELKESFKPEFLNRIDDIII